MLAYKQNYSCERVLLLPGSPSKCLSRSLLAAPANSLGDGPGVVLGTTAALGGGTSLALGGGVVAFFLGGPNPNRSNRSIVRSVVVSYVYSRIYM